MIDDILQRLRNVTTVPAMRAIRREYKPAHPLPIALQLIAHGDIPRLFAYELVQRVPLKLAEIRKLAKGLDSWNSVDAFAMFVSGPAWHDERLPDSELDRWAQSKDRWLRRLALATTIPASRAGGRCASCRSRIAMRRSRFSRSTTSRRACGGRWETNCGRDSDPAHA